MVVGRSREARLYPLFYPLVEKFRRNLSASETT